MTNRILLIDGDPIAYAASSATQSEYDLPEAGGKVVSARLDEATEIAMETVERFRVKLGADDAIVCLSDDINNFRKGVDPTYKGNRKGQRPVHLYDVKDHLAANCRFLRWPRLEADDVMGLVATRGDPGARYCIVSVDKDMAGVPGWLFNPGKDTKPRKIDPLAADRWWMTQTLIGDAVDGYPGCRGVGPKSKWVTAVNEATTLPAMWEIVVEAFESKGFTPADALRQARLARILRHGDYDPSDYTVRLWDPSAH